MKIVFLFGRKDQKKLEPEKVHDDILIGDFDDSFHNLTFKDSMFLTWAKHNCPVKFIFKEKDKI